MRIARLGVWCVAVALQAACHSTTISTDAQELAQLQQDKARLNRVYASVEASLLENQRSDAAMQYARQQLEELKLARLKTCESPASPNTQLRLQYARCQYQATLSDLDKLQQWQKVRYQFSAKTAKNASK